MNHLVPALLATIGALLSSWILVDASSVGSTFALSNYLDEASVVVLGLGVAAACFVAAFMVSRRAARTANAA